MTNTGSYEDLLPTTICITAFNESRNIPGLLNDLDAIKILFPNLFCVITDNASSDETWSLLEVGASSRTWLRIERLNTNRGYGGGLLNSVLNAPTEFVLLMPADRQYSHEAVTKALRAKENLLGPNEGIIYGSRTTRFDGFFGKTQSLVYRLVCRTFLGLKCDDINGLPKILPKPIITQNTSILSSSFFFDAQILKLGEMNGLQLIPCEVEFLERKQGFSSWNSRKFKTYLLTLKEVLNFRKIISSGAPSSFPNQ